MNKFRILIFLIFASIAIVLGLHYGSTKPGIAGFVRQLPPHTIGLTQLYRLSQSGYYIAGITNTDLYLGSPSNPDKIISIPYYGDTTSSNLPLTHSIERDSLSRISVGTRVAVNYPYVYQLDLLWSNALAGLIDASTTLHLISSQRISKMVPLTPDSYIIESFDTLLRTNVLLKVSTSPRPTISGIQPQKIVLPAQIDGLFCTQGSLTYDASSQMIFFSYLYRNETLALDTNLIPRYNSKTIDPIHTANIKLDTFVNDGVTSISFSAPPLLVNYLTAASYPYYYVNSKVISKNEDSATWDKYDVIDVYHQEDGSYAFSFYILKYDGHPINDFRVCGKAIVTLNGPYVQIYKLEY